MAYIGDSCLRIGDIKWNIGSEVSIIPTFVFQSDLVQGILNGFVNLTALVYASEYDSLTYYWSVELKPHDSLVDKNGITQKDDGRSVLLHLDKIGLYKLKLVVNASSGGCSDAGYIHVLCTPFDYNYINQTALDVSWIWKTLPDFWQLASNRDKARIEVFWRGINQMLGADLLNAYNIKESGSIATIRDSVIRRWQPIGLTVDVQSPIIKIVKPQSVISQILAEERGFVKQIAGVDLRSSYTYRLSGIVTGTDKIQIIGKYISRSDIGKNIKLSLVDSKQSISLGAFNIIDVNTIDNKCIITVNYTFDSKVLKQEHEILIDISVGIVEFPCIVSDNYSTLLAPNGKDLLYRRVPKFDNIDEISLNFLSFIVMNNAESSGVTKGDLLQISVLDNNTNIQYTTNINVVDCVDKYVLVDVVSLYDEIVKAVSIFEPNSNIEYTASLIYDYVSSANFVQVIESSFHYSTLDIYMQLTSEISKSYTISFNKVFLRKKTVVSPDVISLTRLTERIERVEFQNNTLIPNDDDMFSASREPLDLIENLDFYVDPNSIKGKMLSCSNSLDNFTTDAFDFNFAGVENNDTLIVKNGFGRGDYIITKISADGSSIYVDPPSVLNFSNADFEIKKERTGDNRHLVFYRQLPSDNPLETLWCESAVVDNNHAVDLNFGSLVKFSYDKWYSLALDTDYKSVVLAILLARMTSPSLSNIQRLTSNVLGIPFTDTKSRIVDINENFMLSDVDGITPVLSSMIVEEIDDLGVPTGIYKNIKFKPNTIFTNSDFTGLAINPATGNKYKIGDTVEQFATIALGVVIEDLYNEEGRKRLKNVVDRHRFKVTISADAANLTGDLLNIVRSFLIDIKPAYTNFILSVSKFLFDDIIIEEDITLRVKTRFFDNPFIAQNIPQIQDEWSPRRQSVDEFSFIPINTDFPTNGTVGVFNNKAYLSSPVQDYLSSLNIRTKTSLPNVRDRVILEVKGEVVKADLDSYGTVNGTSVIFIDDNLSLAVFKKAIDNPGRVKFTFVRYITDNIDNEIKHYTASNEFVPTNNIVVDVGDYVYVNQEGQHRAEIKALVNNGALVYPPLINNVLTLPVFTRIKRETIFPKDVFSGSCRHLGFEFYLNNVVNAVYAGVEPGDNIEFENALSQNFGTVIAVTRTNQIFIRGANTTTDDFITTNIKITRNHGTNVGDKEDETVTSAISDCNIKFLRPGSTLFQGVCRQNAIFCPNDVDVKDILASLGQLIQVKQSTRELTEGKGVGRVVAFSPDIQANVDDIIPYPAYHVITLSENVLPFFDIPIPISFSIIAQTQLKLTRL